MEIYVSKSRVPVIEVQSPSWFRNRPPMFPKTGNLAKKICMTTWIINQDIIMMYFCRLKSLQITV